MWKNFQTLSLNRQREDNKSNKELSKHFFFFSFDLFKVNRLLTQIRLELPLLNLSNEQSKEERERVRQRGRK